MLPPSGSRSLWNWEEWLTGNRHRWVLISGADVEPKPSYLNVYLEPGSILLRLNISSFIFPGFINMLLSNSLHIVSLFSRVFPAEEHQYKSHPLWLNVGRCLIKNYRAHIEQVSWESVVRSHLILMNFPLWIWLFDIFILCLSLAALFLNSGYPQKKKIRETGRSQAGRIKGGSGQKWRKDRHKKERKR